MYQHKGIKYYDYNCFCCYTFIKMCTEHGSWTLSLSLRLDFCDLLQLMTGLKYHPYYIITKIQ